VIERATTQRFSFRLAILLVALGLCVFLWGLGYKLSLYHFHHSGVQRIPVAKLLSRNEDPNATDSSHLAGPESPAADTGTSVAALFVLALVGSSSLASVQLVRRLEPDQPVFAPSGAILNSLFFRPPPALSAL
jgi:hypothetical protein